MNNFAIGCAVASPDCAVSSPKDKAIGKRNGTIELGIEQPIVMID